MYEHIGGDLVSVSPGIVVLDVGGIGYRLRVPTSTSAAVRGRDRVRLYTALKVKDDEIQLYGFATLEEREVFERLLTISGIGAGIALAILSGIPLDEFRTAVAAGQVKSLEKIKGIGRKTAQRVILELKEILVLDEDDPAIRTPGGRDAVQALIALGFPQSQAEKSVRRALESLPDDAPLQDVVKRATRSAHSKG